MRLVDWGDIYYADSPWLLLIHFTFTTPGNYFKKTV